MPDTWKAQIIEENIEEFNQNDDSRPKSEGKGKSKQDICIHKNDPKSVFRIYKNNKSIRKYDNLTEEWTNQFTKGQKWKHKYLHLIGCRKSSCKRDIYLDKCLH